ncbi:MAG: MraY family glycosyltransferase, partial [Planctomycetota bacterium]
ADVVIMLSLAGALVGFLRYNFAPATIYLGDAGSMLVGLIIGVVAIPGSAKSAAAIGLMIPVAIWSIPILDSAAAILRRKLTGRSVFAADRGHLHHSLLTRGWTVRQASMFIALICATTCMSAVLSVVWRNEWIALATVICVVLFLISTKTFGHIEFSLVRDQITYNSLPAAGDPAETSGRERTVRLQGSREWEKLWEAVIESADEHQLTRIKLSINIPSLNEVFYATWSSTKPAPEEDELWRVSHPLKIDGETVGAFDLTGLITDAQRSTLSQIMPTLDFLEPIEEDIRQIRERIQVEREEVRVGRSAVLAAAETRAAADTRSAADGGERVPAASAVQP